MNRNDKLSKFWAVWEYLKKNNESINWSWYVDLYENFDSFDKKISEIISRMVSQTSLFEKDPIIHINERATFIKNKWDEDGVKSILKEDFRSFKGLENVKGVNWFFYKGDISLLDKENDHYISVIGSRQTEPKYKEWIYDVMPNNKIVISGLANGADIYGHQVAILRHQKIIVFPGTNIYKLNFKRNVDKAQILEYVLDGNGIIMTDQFPGSKYFDTTMFLKRNRWMAQMSSETYVLYFKEVSGTIGQMIETLKLDRKIWLPKNVYILNEDFLDNHKSFSNWRERVGIK